MDYRSKYEVSSVKMVYFLAAFVVIVFVQQVNAHSVIIREHDLVLSYERMTPTTCDSEEYRFQSFLTNKLSDCIIECALREHCEVLTYHVDYKMCELHQLNYSTANVTGNCFRVQKRDIHIIQYPCSGPTCERKTTCDRKTKTCQIKECLEVPHLPNGRVRGNLRAVGNRIKYVCDVGFILADPSNDVATCLENGQWSTHGKCVTAPAVGAVCTSSNCNHPSVHCVAQDINNDAYCFCNYGFEFNSAVDICERVCNEFSTDPSEFIMKPAENGLYHGISGYNLKYTNQADSFEKCVRICNEAVPLYLSVDYDNPYCYCGSISEQQYITAHGPLPAGFGKYPFYNRPCVVRLK